MLVQRTPVHQIQEQIQFLDQLPQLAVVKDVRLQREEQQVVLAALAVVPQLLAALELAELGQQIKVLLVVLVIMVPQTQMVEQVVAAQGQLAQMVLLAVEEMVVLV